ncbi:MAG: hypothetical protein H7A52_02105 [Akkermansiaceae bacterium]|nr:hypothetical protein [Akkermansiaceae bacterium]
MTPTEENRARMRTLAGRFRLSGRFSLYRDEDDRIVLRKRHYPVLCALWCYGIMGGVAWAIARGTDGPMQLIGVALCLALATFFVAAAVALDRRAPLLVFDPAGPVLIAGGEPFPVAPGAPPRLGLRKTRFELDGTHPGVCLSVLTGPPGETGHETPIHVELGGEPMVKQIQRFAEEAALEIVSFPAETRL